MKPHLELSDIHMDFHTPQGVFNALAGIQLKVGKGEIISLIGHSGCGKSTVLNIVAGLLQASRGGVIVDGREVNSPGPDRAMVFQNHSLLPWLTVYGNVALAVRQVFGHRKTRAEQREWIEHNLELVSMLHARDKRPHEISGGMKQRVGIARALAMQPQILLMDEPFGALDALTRAQLQDALMEIQAQLGNTVLMVTHDVDEAVLLSDRVVMLNVGPGATIGQVLEVDLPRPRNRLALAEHPDYHHCRAQILRFLHQRHAEPAPVAAGRSERSMLRLLPKRVAHG
ncbi:MAG: ABC transporter ATP-binding protein [Gammaproteobacteria bacterium]|jgi:nitrate/nitrite transport system ATP-binding protein